MEGCLKNILSTSMDSITVISDKFECNICGFIMRSANDSRCPKCDEPIRHNVNKGLFEVDVAHSYETVDLALNKISSAVDQASYQGFSGIKVIHGYGSTCGISKISGPAVQKMRKLAIEYSGKFTNDRGNRGASIIWFQ